MCVVINNLNVLAALKKIGLNSVLNNCTVDFFSHQKCGNISQ